MRILILLFLLLPVFATAEEAAVPRPMTHEDLWLLPRVGGPVTSPDGTQAVLQVMQPAYDKDEGGTYLWLVETDGKTPPRQLTFVKSGESGVTWSPDGERIAFTAKREGDEAAQVYLLDLARGGEAERVTAVSTGAQQPRFSPDGTRIAFTTQVHPEAMNDADSERITKEEKERKYEVHAYDGFPIRHWDRWLNPDRQPRLLVQTIGTDEAVDLLAGTALAREPGFYAAGGLDPAWAPDGESIVFVASRNRHRAAFDFTNSELWQVPVAGGEPRRLTGREGLEGGDNWSAPVFSADGRSLFARRVPRTERVFNAARIVRFDWPAATVAAEITLPEMRTAGDFAVTPNGREVYVLGQDAGLVRLYRGSSRGGVAEPAFEPGTGGYGSLSMSRGGRPVLLATWESAVSPAEVVRIDLRRGGHAALTEFTAAATAELDLPPVEHFWFETEDGRRIHNLLVRPAGFDPARKYPLLVLMHGGPHSMWRDQVHLRWNYHLIAGTDYVLVATNYKGSTGFGEAFAQSIQGDPLKGPAEEINQGADVAVERYDFIDGSRQCAAGASYGGHLASWMLATTDRYRCLVNHAGLVDLASQWGTSDAVYHREVNVGGPPWEGHPLWTEQSPMTFAANFQTPTLVTAGQLDFRVPVNNTLELWTVLQRLQVPSRLLVYPKENHWIMTGHNSRHFYGELASWFQRWLGEGQGEVGAAQ
ncbi:S9 family peptidase [Thioalkalivibrio sp. XN8]|nr:S9 family peptidase [Thioalkalivibrio sp. XN8]